MKKLSESIGTFLALIYVIGMIIYDLYYSWNWIVEDGFWSYFIAGGYVVTSKATIWPIMLLIGLI